MKSKAPCATTLFKLIRTVDERDIRRRLNELAGEEAALRTLLRSLQARNRVKHLVAAATNNREGGRLPR